MTYLILGLAVFRLTRLVTTDTFPPIKALRDRLLAKWPTDDTEFTDEWVRQTATGWETTGGAEVEYFDGYYHPVAPSRWSELLTCSWCASVWCAALTVGAWLLLPAWFEHVLLVPALSAVAGLLTVYAAE